VNLPHCLLVMAQISEDYQLAFNQVSFSRVPGDAQTTISTDATIGIAVGVTTALAVGVLAGIFLYHCISKHQPLNFKPEPFTHHQRQAGPEYEDVSDTRVERIIELRENIAYGPAQKIKIEANEAYGHVQH